MDQHWLRRIGSKLRAAVLRRRLDRDLEDELQFHLSMRHDDYQAEGLGPAQARDAARRRFGNAALLKEACRDTWSFVSLDAFFKDIRYAGRTLTHNSGVTAACILTIALGIGASTATFTAVDNILIQPLPYRSSKQLVFVWDNFLKLNFRHIPAAPAEFLDYRNRNRVFSDVAAFSTGTADLTGSGDPEQVPVAYVSTNLFAVLGAEPAAGRLFSADETQIGKKHVVLISDGLWKRRFGSDPALAGKTLTLDGAAYTIAGIMPARFEFPNRSFQFAVPADIFAPLSFTTAEFEDRGGVHGINVIAALKPGIEVQQAQTDMDRVAAQLESEYPRSYRGPHGEDAGWRLTVVSLQDQVVGRMRPALLILSASVAFVLLIACANVASLLLARAAVRQREFAIRAALGGGRVRLIKQLLTESTLLGVFGGCLGLLIAYAGLRALLAFGPADVPRLNDVTVNGRALAFTLSTSILAGILFGLAPAIRTSGPNLTVPLKENGRGFGPGRRNRLGNALIVAEIALALILVVSAALMAKSFHGISQVDPGFRAENVLTASVELSSTRSSDTGSRETFYNLLLQKLEATPGVQSAALITNLPMSGHNSQAPFTIRGRDYDANGVPPSAIRHVASKGYFKTIGVPLLSGRDFSDEDTDDARAAVIINQKLAFDFWKGGNAVGQQLKIGGPGSPNPWMTIVGVAGAVRQIGLDSEPAPELYLPYIQNPGAEMDVVVRAYSNPADLAPAVRAAVRSIDPLQPVASIATMESIVDRTLAGQRFNAILMSVFAAIALILAAVGIYGLMNYSVAERTREIGICIALGAGRNDILKLVVARGLKLAVAGVFLGAASAFAWTRLLASLLYGVSPSDPSVFIAISVLFIAVALLAAYLPAKRAMSVDPLAALRYE
ncbi:MAG TPA: ABC transporter permease [Blastocatellia bacterium]|nr:ABC transporter permease [Blastocatellia bacterium]